MMKYWYETVAVAQRILTELIRRRRSLISWGVFPISILVINSIISAEKAKLSIADAYAQSAPLALMGAALFFSCLGGSVATVVAEREQQTLKRLFISPLSGTSYFLGIFLAHGVIGLVQTLIVYGITAAVGAPFRGAIWLAGLVILLSVFAYVGVGFILGTQFARRTEDVNSLVAAFGVPLLILGGAFLPIALFPPNLLRVAKLNPIYHMIGALNSVAVDGAGLVQIASDLQYLAGFALAMLMGGWLSYQRMLRVERRL